jgi:hypothetical protein
VISHPITKRHWIGGSGGIDTDDGEDRLEKDEYSKHCDGFETRRTLRQLRDDGGLVMGSREDCRGVGGVMSG